MNKTVNVLLMLLVATFLFHSAINYMARNIGDFENVALPPRKKPAPAPSAPVIQLYPTLTLDAKDKNSWIVVDLSTGKNRRIEDPERQKDLIQSTQWDIGFQRTKIITNGGETNPRGSAGAINLGYVEMNVPVSYSPDQFVRDSRRLGSLTNPALSGWYNYRTRTHNIESKRNVYLFRAADNRLFKLRFTNYYCVREEKDCASEMCPREEAGCITFEYLPYDPASEPSPVTPPTAPPAPEGNKAGS